MKLVKEIGSKIVLEVEIIEFFPQDRNEPIMVEVVGCDDSSFWISRAKSLELGIISSSVNVKCPNCKGTGDFEEFADCYMCNGSGKIEAELSD